MPESCDTVQECCPPDPYAYRSVSAEDSQAGTNGADGECIPANVSISPVSGSYVFFPSFVILTSDNPSAVIRYTVDGTVPTATSSIYTVPFEIFNASTFVQARAFVSGCSPGPVAAALYQNPPFPIGLDYSCTTPDKGGIWDVWAPNGTIDNYWQIEFTLTGNQIIKRLEIEQLSAAGADNTGIMWATDSPIDGVDIMPLLLFIAAAQQHTDYQSSLGTFGAGTHTWDLYGDKQFPAEVGFFQFTMILGDDTRIVAVHSVNCSNSVDPVPCPSPETPTAVAACGGVVTVTFANTIGQAFKLYYSTGGAWTLYEQTVTADNPQDRNVSGLTPGQLYHFRVELEYAGCGFQSSASVSATPLVQPEVSISTSKTLVNPNESFTISWDSDNIGGATCGGCAAGEVSLNQSLGCKAGNTPGSQATSQATPGIYTYQITGCNTCGTVTASVQVEVLNVAACSVQPTTINIANPTSFLCGFEASCLGTCYSAYLFDTPWNGQIPKTENCLWTVCASGGCDHSGAFITFCVWVYLSGGNWVLEIGSVGSTANGCIWRGTKGFGNSPLGVYTRVSGCASGPATITIT